jgi:ArsR family transcriptional regulator
MQASHHAIDLFKRHTDLFVAIGDRNRQQIILLLSCAEPKSVAEIAEHMQLSRPTVSHHLKILKDAQLLSETREGRKTYYYPTFDRSLTVMKQLASALEAKDKEEYGK